MSAHLKHFQAVRERWAPAVRQIKAQNKNLPKDQQKTVRFTGMNFQIDEKVIQSIFLPPSPYDLVNISVSTQQMMDGIDFVASENHIEKGSSFTAYAAIVISLDLITPAYLKKRKVIAPAADHVFMAYCMLQLDGKVQQGSADDGEFFCGLADQRCS